MTMVEHRQILTGADIWLVRIRRRLLNSGDGRLLGECRLRCLKEGQLRLSSEENDLHF